MPSKSQIDEAIRRAKQEDLVDFREFKDRLDTSDRQRFENIAKDAWAQKDRVTDNDQPPPSGFIGFIEGLIEQIKSILQNYI